MRTPWKICPSNVCHYAMRAAIRFLGLAECDAAPCLSLFGSRKSPRESFVSSSFLGTGGMRSIDPTLICLSLNLFFWWYTVCTAEPSCTFLACRVGRACSVNATDKILLSLLLRSNKHQDLVFFAVVISFCLVACLFMQRIFNL